LAGIVPPVRTTVDGVPNQRGVIDAGTGEAAVGPPVEAVPPAQVVLALPETTTPVGKVSVKGALRLAAVLFWLVKVMVKVEVPPALMVAGLKALPTVGVTTTTLLTVNVATAGAALFPLLVTKAPEASELM
jgi:hypothetical protein